MKESTKIRIGFLGTLISLIIGVIFGIFRNYQMETGFLCMAFSFFVLTSYKPLMEYKSKIREEEKLNEAKKEENDH